MVRRRVLGARAPVERRPDPHPGCSDHPGLRRGHRDHPLRPAVAAHARPPGRDPGRARHPARRRRRHRAAGAGRPPRVRRHLLGRLGRRVDRTAVAPAGGPDRLVRPEPPWRARRADSSPIPAHPLRRDHVRTTHGTALRRVPHPGRGAVRDPGPRSVPDPVRRPADAPRPAATHCSSPAAEASSPPPQRLHRPGVPRDRAHRHRPGRRARRPHRVPRERGHPGLPPRPHGCQPRRPGPRPARTRVRIQRVPRGCPVVHARHLPHRVPGAQRQQRR